MPVFACAAVCRPTAAGVARRGPPRITYAVTSSGRRKHWLLARTALARTLCGSAASAAVPVELRLPATLLQKKRGARRPDSAG